MNNVQRYVHISLFVTPNCGHESVETVQLY